MKKNEKTSDKKPVKKNESKPKAKKKKRPVKETTTPTIPVSNANSGYIPFGG